MSQGPPGGAILLQGSKCSHSHLWALCKRTKVLVPEPVLWRPHQTQPCPPGSPHSSPRCHPFCVGLSTLFYFHLVKDQKG